MQSWYCAAVKHTQIYFHETRPAYRLQEGCGCSVRPTASRASRRHHQLAIKHTVASLVQATVPHDGTALGRFDSIPLRFWTRWDSYE